MWLGIEKQHIGHNDYWLIMLILIPFQFQILVEFDYVEWDKREWLNVYKDNFHLLAVEQNLVLAHRPHSLGNLQPALASSN